MTSSRHLHKEANRLRQKMQLKLNDADRASKRADTYNKLGDFNRGSIESELSSKHYNEAMKLEKEALECERKATELELKAAEIEREEVELQSKMQTKIDILEKLKRALRGDY